MSHCNRPAEPGQGSSTRCRRAAAWHHAEHFLAGYNRVRINAANVHAFFSSRGLDKGTTLVEQTEAPTEKVITFDEARNNCMEKYKDTDYYYVFKNSFEISPDSSSPTMSYKGSKYDSSSVNAVDYMNQELGFSDALFKK